MTTLPPPQQSAEPAPLSMDHLPSLPWVAMEVIELCKAEDVGLTELAEAISKDPSLAIKLLQYANSSQYSHIGETVSLQRACFALGFAKVKVLALGFSISGAFSSKVETSNFDIQKFWQKSILTASAAQLISKELGLGTEDEAFVCGLLSRLGQLAFAYGYPKQYDELIEACGDPLPTAEDEFRAFGFNQHYFAYRLMEQWNLPESIAHVVGDWPHGIESDKNYSTCEVIRIADKVSDAILTCNALGIQEAREQMWDSFAIDEAAVVELLIQLKESAMETAEVMDVSSSNVTELMMLIDSAQKEIVKISLESSDQLQQKTNELEVEKQENKQWQDEAEKLKKKADTDGLTGVLCRRAFDERLRSLIEQQAACSSSSRDTELTVSSGLLVMDIDHFKSINDNHGHTVGDEVLIQVCRTIEKSLRSSDLLFRYGGEEFTILLPETTLETLECIAERVRENIESLVVPLNGGSEVNPTISIGGVNWVSSDNITNGHALIESADMLLYHSKNEGRNRCNIRSFGEMSKLRERHVI